MQDPRRNLYLLVVTATICGCASIYVAPSSGPVARVRVKAEPSRQNVNESATAPTVATDGACSQPVQLGMHEYRGSEFKPEDAARVSQFRREAFPLNMPEPPAYVSHSSWTEIIVPAGKPVSFNFGYGRRETNLGGSVKFGNCSVSGIFKFEANKDYEVKFDFDRNSNGCVVKAVEYVRRGAVYHEEPVALLPQCK